jgi:hypothetical protein
MTIENHPNSVYCLGNVQVLFENLKLTNQCLTLNNKYYSADLYFSTIRTDATQAVIYTLRQHQEYPVECKDLDAEIKIIVGERESEELYLKSLDDGFEYIAWDGEEGGRNRIIECLEAHLWPVRKASVPATLPGQDQFARELSDSLFGVESFEQSISKMKELRSQLQQAGQEERIQLAEQVAMAFDLFLEDDEYADFTTAE